MLCPLFYDDCVVEFVNRSGKNIFRKVTVLFSSPSLYGSSFPIIRTIAFAHKNAFGVP